ncbi:MULTISPECIES: type II toxin-antitoxin system Phd/YefM family antitoxin [Methylosinus]|uniref:Antitoxin n=1 Tax=Methylosinus trichosporium (strain ATCC 35070 / NCIMB 11131 / UNIQEM 75 / OB3b) TaxID=595536 RepID=A0A2D2D3B7_METT3|nr:MULTISPECIES: type II toxin-antitoxin system prevent-host-death family antitoxin [Methylosinus]ATQ69464.1 type II toxin-antitoxin system prevent-host-death family antitoxin [Methylosinus trichosporium OB3b]OBS52974.1 prevent-host-death protein [Methylosinus sp. 3S-1]
MTTVTIQDAQERLAELTRRVEEAGEKVVVTRDGRPVVDLVPHRETHGLNLDAGRSLLKARGIAAPAPFIADDFDEPLPEDILLRPLS